MADFKAQLSAAGSKLVVVDFHATWCGPCKMIAPHIVEMDGKMDNVVFLKVDVDEAEDVAAEYNISAMPTFVFIKDGEDRRPDGCQCRQAEGACEQAQLIK